MSFFRRPAVSDEARRLPGSKTDSARWDPGAGEMSDAAMDERMWHAAHQRSWDEAGRFIVRERLALAQLKVAEVGCGTGTMALTFALLGASVTLVDRNDKVIRHAQQLYERRACRAAYMCADCCAQPPASLAGSFDLVMSFGLAEHFTGAYRDACMRYHYSLARNGGLVLMHVPNRLSPAYRIVRGVREVTGRWGIDVEEGYTPAELASLAASVGFRSARVIGYMSPGRDCIDHLRGLRAAAVDALPHGLAQALRRAKKAATLPGGGAHTAEQVTAYCRERLAAFEGAAAEPPPVRPADAWCSNIVLCAIK